MMKLVGIIKIRKDGDEIEECLCFGGLNMSVLLEQIVSVAYAQFSGNKGWLESVDQYGYWYDGVVVLDW